MIDLDTRLRQLQLKTRHPVEHLLAGEYRSVFKGRGMDFDEIRPYEPGDDIRSMDWNVTARTGHPHTKRYIEERELVVWFLVDTSASCRMGYGDRTKWDALHEMTALLTLSATRNNDRTGLILFSDRVERVIPPLKGSVHAMRLLHEILSVKPQGRRTDLQPALDAVARLTRRRSLVFILSDFLFETRREQLSATGFRQDLIAIAVNDPQEVTPPVCGLVALADSETGQTLLCDLNSNHQADYRNAFIQQRIRLKTELEAVGADLIEIDSQADCVERLTLFFRNRLRRSADETGG